MDMTMESCRTFVTVLASDAPAPGGGTMPPLDMNLQVPVQGGQGYGQLQRALNQTGVV